MTDFAAYRLVPAVNASSLKWMATSPLHFRYYRDHSGPDSPAMFAGRAAHCAVLQPDRLLLDYTTYAERRQGKAWEAFKAANSDKEILSQAEYDEALTVRDAVRAHSVAGGYLSKGEAETVLEWTDAETGLKCKARPDWIRPGMVCDLKTSRRIDPRNFSRTTHDLLYHVQAAHYVAGADTVYGGEHRFAFIAAESNPPHDVRAGLLSDDALYAGEEERRRLLRLVADCTASGEWPGAYPDESEFDLPDWYYTQAEYDLTGLGIFKGEQ